MILVCGKGFLSSCAAFVKTNSTLRRHGLHYLEKMNSLNEALLSLEVTYFEPI